MAVTVRRLTPRAPCPRPPGRVHLGERARRVRRRRPSVPSPSRSQGEVDDGVHGPPDDGPPGAAHGPYGARRRTRAGPAHRGRAHRGRARGGRPAGVDPGRRRPGAAHGPRLPCPPPCAASRSTTSAGRTRTAPRRAAAREGAPARPGARGGLRPRRSRRPGGGPAGRGRGRTGPQLHARPRRRDGPGHHPPPPAHGVDGVRGRRRDPRGDALQALALRLLAEDPTLPPRPRRPASPSAWSNCAPGSTRTRPWSGAPPTRSPWRRPSPWRRRRPAPCSAAPAPSARCTRTPGTPRWRRWTPSAGRPGWRSS